MLATGEVVPGGSTATACGSRSSSRPPDDRIVSLTTLQYRSVWWPSGERPSGAEPRWVDDDRALAELVKVLRRRARVRARHRVHVRAHVLAAAVPGAGVVAEGRRARSTRSRATCARSIDVLHAPATMITHAGASDLPILERAVGARPSALFDVQLAAGFVGLGLPSLGSLVSVLLGDPTRQVGAARRLVGAPAVRPAVRQYAAADVEHLFPLTLELDHRLQDLGRESVGGERVRAAAQERRPARRSRRRVVADQGRVVDPRREGARRAVRRRVA